MRWLSVLAGLLLVAPAAKAANETEVVPDKIPAATLTAEQPVNPQASKSGAPIITSISARANVPLPNGTVLDIVPEFHYVAPNGNAIVLHREIVESNNTQVRINNAGAINAPGDAQKRGAVITGGWRCGPSQYYVTMKAYIMDADGNHSNTVQYTIHCNGG